MGLFGIGELLIAVEEEFHVKAISSKVEWREVFRTLAGLPRYGWALLRSAAIGCWMGITPGGPTAASFMSYGIAKRLSPRRANFGKGEPEGIVAPEAADHCRRHQRAASDAVVGHPGIGDRCRHDGRPDDLGTESRTRCCSSSKRTSSGD
jgi:TctA family transporter